MSSIDTIKASFDALPQGISDRVERINASELIPLIQTCQNRTELLRRYLRCLLADPAFGVKHTIPEACHGVLQAAVDLCDTGGVFDMSAVDAIDKMEPSVPGVINQIIAAPFVHYGIADAARLSAEWWADEFRSRICSEYWSGLGPQDPFSTIIRDLRETTYRSSLASHQRWQIKVLEALIADVNEDASQAARIPAI